MIYDNGYVKNYREWIGKYANSYFDHFARHNSGKSIDYHFNSLGYRGPEHFETPDISVFGSSFSFGVGIDFSCCWHQQLGNYQVNCYAPAGFLVTNEDIIEHCHRTKVESGIVILQLREFRYNKSIIHIPNNIPVFVIDEHTHHDILTFTWSSFVDKAEDNTHPGCETHKLWSQKIKQQFSL